MSEEKAEKGGMTVAEAGRKGGMRTAEKYEGTDFYQKVGKKGGQTVRKLIEKGKEAEEGEK